MTQSVYVFDLKIITSTNIEAFEYVRMVCQLYHTVYSYVPHGCFPREIYANYRILTYLRSDVWRLWHQI